MSAAPAPTYLLYSLALRSPVIAATLPGDPNSVATQPFIPGSAIRGAVAARLLADGTTGDSKEFRQLVLSGSVRYLHAYPEIAGARGLPATASWRSTKSDPDQARDLAAFSGRITEQTDPEDFLQVWPEEPLAAIGGYFAAPTSSAGARELQAPRIRARLHQQRDRAKGRPWLEKREGHELPRGAIFAFEYLDAEQAFRGAIQVMDPTPALVGRIKALLCQPLLIGRSRRAGYGGDAVLTFTAAVHREYEDVSGSLSADVRPGQRFRVMLASAFIGRHPSTGQIDPVALELELGEKLGGQATVERRRWGFELIGSFNQKWRLEVPQVWAVSGGATLVLMTATQPIPLSTLRDVEHEGLGERRIEGFGRVLFLQHSEDGETFRLRRSVERPTSQHGAGTPPSDVQEAVRIQIRFLEGRIVLAAARTELDRLASDLAMQPRRLPTNSLLGRVRTLFRNERDEATAQAALRNLRTWCSEGDPNALKATARRNLEACSPIGAHNLLQWLDLLSRGDESKDQWTKLLAAVGNASTLSGLAHSHQLTTRPSADGILRQHAALLSAHLIDAVLATLARRNQGGPR
jgi:CRISPR-associated protein Csx10